MARFHANMTHTLVAAALTLFAVTQPRQAQSQVTVSPTVTTNGSLFHYDFAVTNGTNLDLSLVTIDVAALADVVRNLSTPNGFNAVFDPVFGTVDFREVTTGFSAGSTISGFQFDSPLAPTASTFHATGLDPDSDRQVTFSGSTLAPAAAVPEPSWQPLAVCGAAGWLLSTRSRKRSWRNRRIRTALWPDDQSSQR